MSAQTKRLIRNFAAFDDSTRTSRRLEALSALTA